MSEGVESFGAQGYIESTNIPVIMRDAQVILLKLLATNLKRRTLIGSSDLGRHDECLMQ